MNTSFRTAFEPSTTRPTASVVRVRPMPLKNAFAAHSAAASGPPIMRGIQNWTASASTSGASPKPRIIAGPSAMVSPNAGIVSTDAHNPIQAIRVVRQYRPAP